MSIVAVKDFEQAREISLEVLKEWIKIIELYGEFGYKATAKIKDAVGDTADLHGESNNGYYKFSLVEEST